MLTPNDLERDFANWDEQRTFYNERKAKTNGLTPIKTEFNGTVFDSRLEARWAIFFYKLGIKYKYEPVELTLSDGVRYTPDFWLPDFRCFFEVKSANVKNAAKERMRAEQKIADSKGIDWGGIITYGDPYNNDCYLFARPAFKFDFNQKEV